MKQSDTINYKTGCDWQAKAIANITETMNQIKRLNDQLKHEHTNISTRI